MSKKLYSVISDIISKDSLTDKCLVLDIDNTLLKTYDDEDLSKLGIMTNPKQLKIRNRIYHFEIDYPGYEDTRFMWGITRPHLTEFLIFCISYFKLVCIWSAGDRPYVEGVIGKIFKDLKRPHVIYVRDDCEDPDGKVLKDLSKMMKDPVTLGYMTPMNTLTIDDNVFAIRKNINNAIEIPFYSPEISKDVNETIRELGKNDPSLLQIIRWLSLDHVKNSRDVRKLDKSWIFTKTLEEYDKMEG